MNEIKINGHTFTPHPIGPKPFLSGPMKRLFAVAALALTGIYGGLRLMPSVELSAPPMGGHFLTAQEISDEASTKGRGSAFREKLAQNSCDVNIDLPTFNRESAEEEYSSLNDKMSRGGAFNDQAYKDQAIGLENLHVRTDHSRFTKRVHAFLAKGHSMDQIAKFNDDFNAYMADPAHKFHASEIEVFRNLQGNVQEQVVEAEGKCAQRLYHTKTPAEGVKALEDDATSVENNRALTSDQIMAAPHFPIASSAHKIAGEQLNH